MSPMFPNEPPIHIGVYFINSNDIIVSGREYQHNRDTEGQVFPKANEKATKRRGRYEEKASEAAGCYSKATGKFSTNDIVCKLHVIFQQTNVDKLLIDNNKMANKKKGNAASSSNPSSSANSATNTTALGSRHSSLSGRSSDPVMTNIENQHCVNTTTANSDISMNIGDKRVNNLNYNIGLSVIENIEHFVSNSNIFTIYLK